jgi:hypothetical protein
MVANVPTVLLGIALAVAIYGDTTPATSLCQGHKDLCGTV